MLQEVRASDSGGSELAVRTAQVALRRHVNVRETLEKWWRVDQLLDMYSKYTGDSHPERVRGSPSINSTTWKPICHGLHDMSVLGPCIYGWLGIWLIDSTETCLEFHWEGILSAPAEAGFSWHRAKMRPGHLCLGNERCLCNIHVSPHAPSGGNERAQFNQEEDPWSCRSRGACTTHLTVTSRELPVAQLP